MSRSLGIAAFLVGTTLSADALGCRTMRPSSSDLDAYSEILVGRVTGIRLDWYANRLLDKPDMVVPDAGGLAITDGSGPVRVYAVVTTARDPGERHERSFTLSGCTFNLPSLRQPALFFLGNDASYAIAVWENDPSFAGWLDELGVAPDDF